MLMPSSHAENDSIACGRRVAYESDDTFSHLFVVANNLVQNALTQRETWVCNEQEAVIQIGPGLPGRTYWSTKLVQEAGAEFLKVLV